MGTATLSHTIFENSSSTYPYDFWIQTEISGVSPFDIEYSIKFTSEQKQATINNLKALQSSIYNDAVNYFPNKKIQGGYYNGFYEYPYIKVGYDCVRFLTWVNYVCTLDTTNPDLFDLLMDYDHSRIGSFRWLTVFDDYDFTK
jgi:hypothetical protein